MPLIEAALLKRKLRWLDDGDRRAIAAFPDELVAELAEMVGATAEGLAAGLAFWAKWAPDEAPPSPPRDTSDELQALAQALDEAELRLFEASPAAKEALCAELPAFASHRLEFARRLEPIRRATWAAVRKIKVPKGRPRREDLLRLVDGLANVFEETTGRRAGLAYDWKRGADASVFPCFCRKCITAIHGDPGPLTGIVREVARLRRMTEKTPPPSD